MRDITLTHAQWVALFNKLHEYYDKIDDRNNIILCNNFEPAINQYQVDTLIQILDNPNPALIDLHICNNSRFYQEEIEGFIEEVCKIHKGEYHGN